jgi:hypothetical protein
MNDLERSYTAKRAEYETLIATSNPSVEAVKKLNQDLAEILNKMLVELAKVKEDAGHIGAHRDNLVKKLVAVQKDYNELLGEKDQLATLKTMRQGQDIKFNGAFYMYVVGLAVVSLLFFLVLMWKGGYKAPTIPMTTINPTTMDAFTYR